MGTSHLVIKFIVMIIKVNLLILMPTFNLRVSATNFSLLWLVRSGQGRNLNKVKGKSAAVQFFNISFKTEVVMHLSTQSHNELLLSKESSSSWWGGSGEDAGSVYKILQYNIINSLNNNSWFLLSTYRPHICTCHLTSQHFKWRHCSHLLFTNEKMKM